MIKFKQETQTIYTIHDKLNFSLHITWHTPRSSETRTALGPPETGEYLNTHTSVRWWFVMYTDVSSLHGSND